MFENYPRVSGRVDTLTRSECIIVIIHGRYQSFFLISWWGCQCFGFFILKIKKPIFPVFLICWQKDLITTFNLLMKNEKPFVDPQILNTNGKIIKSIHKVIMKIIKSSLVYVTNIRTCHNSSSSPSPSSYVTWNINLRISGSQYTWSTTPLYWVKRLLTLNSLVIFLSKYLFRNESKSFSCSSLPRWHPMI